MNESRVESLRQAMLDETLAEVIQLHEAVKALATTLGTAVPQARSEIEKGGEFAALKFGHVADERIAKMNTAMRDIAALRELLVGEVARQVDAQRSQQLSALVQDMVGRSNRRRLTELLVCGLGASAIALAVAGVAPLLLHSLIH